MLDHAVALGRERDAGSAFVEQLAPEQHLQTLDLRAHRRLRHPEAMRGLGEAAKLDDRDQRSQQLGRNIGHVACRRGCNAVRPGRNRASRFYPTRPRHFRSVENSKIFCPKTVRIAAKCGFSDEMGRNVDSRPNFLVLSRPTANRCGVLPSETLIGARCRARAYFAAPRTRRAGLSKTITLDTKAFMARVWVRPLARATAPKSSSR